MVNETEADLPKMPRGEGVINHDEAIHGAIT
jgi:hypothetical protein